ncbi:5'/3'-nucleotidase SurE [Aeoliella mucimassa]|uniref:5'-nucleotidase SurE n=1 Tax=Aeoliella mucimassa TaxID=2527972 RepID=A0A518AL37_9BACT|nr:5'/3'-nucleotidase SurE [Aeoliella mucimassa]QDU55406.1 5'-nucleotidase SurE [Aeoliella mucimassa]
MLILLTNDDGIYAPGLAAMERELQKLGDVVVVAPATEQSGVGHSITFLTPLMAKEASFGDDRRGWAVEGSPADCVKLAIAKFCPQQPDLVVSGINGGLNVGINVLYSGTVAAATEGALHGIPSIAVSLEYDDNPRFDRAAEMGVQVIEQLLEKRAFDKQKLYSFNMSTAASLRSVDDPPELHVVPMGVARWPAEFEERRDPKGRRYYWATGTPPTGFPQETDLNAIQQGHVTLTPLEFDRTRADYLAEMKTWDIKI